MLIFLLISLLSFADSKLPKWITDSPLSESNNNYVTCSHDDIDPDEARVKAEAKCLISASKIKGVSVKLNQKTIQTLSGVDSSETAEIHPLESNVSCIFSNRYLERIKDGYRIWLRCKIQYVEHKASSSPHVKAFDLSTQQAPKEYLIYLSVIPTPDKVIITGKGPARIIDVNSNTIQIKWTSYDELLEIQKAGYRTYKINTSNLNPDTKNLKTITLDKN